MNREELNQLVEHARASLSEDEFRKLKGVVEALTYLTDLVADQETTIQDLRELLFPASTEKTKEVLKKAGLEGTRQSTAENPSPSQPREGKRDAPGHGRNGAGDYRNPRRVTVSHASLKHGDRCPGCLKGKVYEQQEPRRLVRIVGQAPLTATVYELQRLRCFSSQQTDFGRFPHSYYAKLASSVSWQRTFSNGERWAREEVRSDQAGNLSLKLTISLYTDQGVWAGIALFDADDQHSAKGIREGGY